MMYVNKFINHNNAQLIFTAHSTYLFNSNDLERDELYIVDKNLIGKSKLYSLSEFRNLRIDADYEKNICQVNLVVFDLDFRSYYG